MKKKTIGIILIVILSIMILAILGIVIYNKVFNTTAIFEKSIDVVYDNVSKLLSNEIIYDYDYEKDIVNSSVNISYAPSEEIKTLLALPELESTGVSLDVTTDFSNDNSIANISYLENNNSIIEAAFQMDTQAIYIDLKDIFSQVLMTNLPDDYQAEYDKMIEDLKISKEYNNDINELLDISREIVKDQIKKENITQEEVSVTINNINHNVTKNNYTLEGEDLYNTIHEIISKMNENNRVNEIMTKHEIGSMQEILTSLESSKNNITQNKIIISIYSTGIFTPVGVELTDEESTNIQYINIDNNYYFNYEDITSGENMTLEGLKNSDDQITLTYTSNDEDMANITYQETNNTKKLGIESIDKKSNIQIEYNQEDTKQELKIIPSIEEVNLGTITLSSITSKVDSLDLEINTNNAIDINSLTEEQQLQMEQNLIEKALESQLLSSIVAAYSNTYTENSF